jgi:predicted RNA binding protein YcfA (HicA-like mRNA interferase family)
MPLIRWAVKHVGRKYDSFRQVKVRELIALIEADGWLQVRQKGSHRQFHHPSKSGTVTVAGKPSVDVPAGTLNSALKQAGLK